MKGFQMNTCFYRFSGVREGTLLIDSSTIDPAVSKEMSKLAAESSATYMDAPVSGGSKIIFLKF